MPSTSFRSESAALPTALADPKWFRSARLRVGPIPGMSSSGFFEIAFDLSPGGVMSHVRLDYGEFTLDAALEKLETLPAPDCD